MRGAHWFLVALSWVFCALPAAAQQVDQSGLDAHLTGEMTRLQVGLGDVPSVAFISDDGAPMTLDAFSGKLVLVNFWAPWCAHCREEMPQLSQVQTDLGNEDFEVVTIAVGQNRPETLERFFSEIGADNLPLHTDPSSRLSGAMGVLGLPSTILISPEGHEIARLQGPANWVSPEAIAFIRQQLSGTGSP